MSRIKKIIGRKIIDSRGNPTIEVEVHLEGGFVGLAAAPSSGGLKRYRESIDIRDGNMSRLGKEVTKAVDVVNGPIANAIIGKNAKNQFILDNIMIDLDGTKNKSKFVSNAILSVSFAVAKAASISKRMPLYQHIADLNGTPGKFLMPLPMITIINGGKHAANNIDFKEFMIQPVGAKSIKEAVRIGTEVFQNLAKILKSKGMNTYLGDEGGYIPHLESNIAAIEIIKEAVNKSGYILGTDITIAINCAASDFFEDNCNYHLKCEGKKFNSKEFTHYLEFLTKKYPIISIEDGISESDCNGFAYQNKLLGNKIQLVVNDLFVNNKLKNGKQDIANSILIKVNQSGSLTEILSNIKLAKNAGYTTVISNSYGETEDATISDLAVGTSVGQIKIGSIISSERVAKYNQLLRIEEALNGKVSFYILNKIKI